MFVFIVKEYGSMALLSALAIAFLAAVWFAGLAVLRLTVKMTQFLFRICRIADSRRQRGNLIWHSPKPISLKRCCSTLLSVVAPSNVTCAASSPKSALFDAGNR